MSTRGNKGGVNRPVEFIYFAVAGQSLFSGADINGIPMSFRASPGLVDVYLNGKKLVPVQDYTLLGSTQVLLNGAVCTGTDVLVVKALFPYNAVDGLTVAASDAAYGRRRNRIIDPGMRVSQEQGNGLITLAAATTYNVSDSIVAFRTGTTGAATVQRIASLTPGGSPYRIRATVTAANAAPATGDILTLQTKIEGLDVADLRFGTLSPRTVSFRFGCRASVAGTYAVTLTNGAANRAWIGSVTISAGEVGQDVVKSVTLLGDQTGTWATDNTLGMALVVTLCAGSSFQGVAGWQPGSLYSLAGCTNLMATVGATFDLFDVGLYDVTGLTPGVIPNFELKSFNEDLNDCQRYYFKTYTLDVLPGTGGSQYAGVVRMVPQASQTYHNMQCEFAREMRSVPSCLLYSPANGASGFIFWVGNSNVAGYLPYIGTKRCSVTVQNVTIGGGTDLMAHVVANARL